MSAAAKSGRQIVERVCCECGEPYGTEGQLPFACDHHVENGELLLTCSKRCRVRRGLPERKSVGP